MSSKLLPTFPSKLISKLGKLVVLVLCVGLFSSCKTTFGRLTDYRTAGDEAYRQGDYPKAEAEYKAAIKEAEKLGSDVMVVICLRSLAQVYVAQNKVSEAETIYKKRIVLAEKSLHVDPEYEITVYDDLATFYILENRISEAKPVYERAILWTQRLYGADDLRVAEKLDYYARLLKAKQQDAGDLENQASRIREKIQQAGHQK